jgi:hypothetical protein
VNGIDNSNTIADPMLSGISRTTDGGLNPMPMEGSPAFSEPFSAPVNDFFDDANFKGAFSPTTGNWAAGWTYLSQAGYLATTPGWINSPTFGFVYSEKGDATAGQWVFAQRLGKYIYLGNEDAGGYWTYISK